MTCFFWLQARGFPRPKNTANWIQLVSLSQDIQYSQLDPIGFTIPGMIENKKALINHQRVLLDIHEIPADQIHQKELQTSLEHSYSA
jgi:hypothetical protein